nr:MAG TPA: hypothetical protein [Caudoviricetes sp.]
MSDFNHFSIRRGNETQIVQKRNANSAEAKKYRYCVLFELAHRGHCVDFQSD